MPFGEVVMVRPGRVLDPRTGDRVPRPGGVEYPLVGCVIAPGAAGEVVTGERDGDWDVVTVYATGHFVPVDRRDQLVVRGEVYDVEGQPPAWIDPEGDTSLGGIMVTGRRAEG